MFDIVVAVFEAFGLDAKARTILFRVAWIAFVTGHIAWVCGWLVPIGLAAPFASASEFSVLAAEIHQERIERLQSEITTQRTLQCHAVKAQNWEASDLYAERLRWLRERYKIAAKEEPVIQDCNSEAK